MFETVALSPAGRIGTVQHFGHGRRTLGMDSRNRPSAGYLLIFLLKRDDQRKRLLYTSVDMNTRRKGV